MAKDSSRKQGWRDAAAPGAPARPVEKPWRSPREQTGQGPSWWQTRWARLVFVTSSLLMVTMLTIMIVYWWRPAKPLRLVLIGAGYEDNRAVPLNVAGRKSLESLRRWAEESGKDIASVELNTAPDAVKRALEVSRFEK